MEVNKCNSCFYGKVDSSVSPCSACEGYNMYTKYDIYAPDTMKISTWDDAWDDNDEFIELSDAVSSPKHYTTGKYEVIDVIEDWDLNFRLANTIKYIARHKHKGKPLEDLKKALWYLEREIDKWNSLSKS